MKLSVIMPFRDEEESAESTVDAVHHFFLKEKIDFEIIAVDDSSDRTYLILTELAKERSNIKVINGGASPTRKGYGAALKRGMELAQGDVIIPINGDLCDSLPDSVLMFRLIQSGASVVVASRFLPDAVVKGVRPSKRWASWLGNVFLSGLFRIGMTDVTNSFKAYRKAVFEQVAPSNVGFSYTLELFLGALIQGYDYEQIPTTYVEREAGESKMDIGRIAKEYLYVALRLVLRK